MKKLLVYLKDYKRESILGPLFKMLEALFELLVPLVIAAMIDRGIAQADRGYIIRMSLLLAALGAVGLASSITAQYFAAKAATGFAKKLRRALFSHIQSLSFSEMDRLGTSTLITRLTSDMNQLQTGVNLTLRLLLRSPFVVLGSMVMAFTIDVQAACIFAVTIPALSAVVFGIMVWCIPLYKRVQTRLDRVLGMTRENLSGARVIRAFCKENDEIRTFTQENETLAQAQKYVGRISALMNPVTYVMINAAIIWLIWTGAVRVNDGALTQGQVVALYNYMAQILVELIKFANLILTVTRSAASSKRISDILDVPGGLPQGTQTENTKKDAPSVTFDGVSLSYHAGAEEAALTSIHFSAQRGQVIGIIGGTGAGKSSLVNLIPRFYDATDGRVLVNGLDVHAYSVQALRRKIGVVPQKAMLFQGTLRDNLRWGKPDASDAEIDEALEIAQAKEVADAKGGLDFWIEQNGRNLSGGQKQRFTIARALVGKPQILILDDSASALDFATDAALRRAILSMDHRPTVFLVSQRASTLQHADQIIVLDDGAAVGIGTSDALLKSCAVYREIYESQFRKEDAVHAQG